MYDRDPYAMFFQTPGGPTNIILFYRRFVSRQIAAKNNACGTIARKNVVRQNRLCLKIARLHGGLVFRYFELLAG